MINIINFYKDIKLVKFSYETNDIFFKFIIKNKLDIKNNNMAFFLNDTQEKISSFCKNSLMNDKCLYFIYKSSEIIGYISIGEFFSLNEISFYLDPDHRNIKNYCNGEKSFTDLLTIFLKEFFKNKSNDHILMWGTRYNAVISQHIAQKLSFVLCYEVNDEVEYFNECPILTKIFFSNKQIFLDKINNTTTDTENTKNNYLKLFKELNKNKMTKIDDFTLENMNKILKEK